MLCDRCGENEASVHLTRIINGQKEEIHLCEDCARKSSKLNSDDNNLSFQSLLSGILNHNFSNQDSSFFSNKNSEKVICPNCGLSYQEFTQSGLFGCGECFKVFDKKLDDLFKRIHGNTRHSGKYPLSFKQKIEAESEINQLKIDMQTAVENEDFERAAKIRDEIHAIKDDMEEEQNGK
ncbi:MULTISPECIES: UvrB/UvrC motif-containing protein [Halanaerobium]|jgi:protein arginine kinase activator|uniref:Protein arginine kinase activator n=1 Tax=Halanaerobium kushneri TaxID=56779 RepID=A0A1N7CDW0_9FIRM|nr:MULTISPECIES: UvrB/UvrC motif-containing protein [Halanaerobium]RCW53907.1 protein arginine kinase activator [Halanaerobium sp. ST460_2HS_T2]SIR61770.1 protein arginine kinase activator [Halanaerobium kushneri]